MDLAIEYIREAQSYLSNLEPEFHLDELLCESYEEDVVNESTISLFLESGNTDGEKKDDNKELKKKKLLSDNYLKIWDKRKTLKKTF